MAVPSDPALIVTDPRPLNPAGFPYVVIPFPVDVLLQNGGFNVPNDKDRSGPQESVNFEPGQH